MESFPSYPEDFATPLDKFYHWESLQPDTVWLTQCHSDGDITYTWSEAGALARKLASGLLSLGLEPGDRVGIYSINTARWLITDLAIMMAGLVSVPIYATMPENKVRHIVEHSEMKALVTGEGCQLCPDQLMSAFDFAMSIIGEGGHFTWEELTFRAAPLSGNPKWPFDRLWTICYTSGTTGSPKGVMHSFASAAYSAYCFAGITGLEPGSRFFSYLPLAHIAERVVVELHCYYVGGMIAFNQNLETFASDLKRTSPHFFNSVPRIWANLKAGIVAQLGQEQWRSLMQDDVVQKQMGEQILANMGLDKVVWALSGSAPIAPDLIREWRALGLPLVEGYAQTETMNGLYNSPDHFKIGTVGRTPAQTKAKISQQGELLLSSLGNMLGYYKDPEKTTETLVDGWIHTGDKASVDSDGFYTITGRVKEIFKTAKGKYVAPAPIEGQFSRLDGVAQCCLVGRGLPQTMMLMVADETIQLDENSLAVHLDHINASLEAHEQMSHIIVCKKPWSMDNGLLTHTLKMLRDDIENQYRSMIETALTVDEKRILFEHE